MKNYRYTPCINCRRYTRKCVHIGKRAPHNIEDSSGRVEGANRPDFWEGQERDNRDELVGYSLQCRPVNGDLIENFKIVKISTRVLF